MARRAWLAAGAVVLIAAAAFPLWGIAAVLIRTPDDVLVAGSATIAVGVPALVGFILVERLDHPIGRLMIVIGALLAASSLAEFSALLLASSDMTLGTMLKSLSDGLLGPVLAASLSILFVFPTGSPFGRLGRIGIAAAWVGLGSLTVITTWLTATVDFGDYGPPGQASRVSNPLAIVDLGIPRDTTMAVAAGLLATLLVAATIDLARRWRRSDRPGRLQLVWFATIALGGILALGTSTAIQPSPIAAVLWFGGLAGIPIAMAVAIVHRGLYDLEFLVRRTIVAGMVGAFIVGTYTVVVVGFGSVIGRVPGDDLLLPLIATAMIAVAAEPIRASAQRTANRLVFGDARDPLSAVTELTREVSPRPTPEAFLSRLAETAARSVRGRSAFVRYTAADGSVRVSSWPARADTNADGAVATFAMGTDQEQIGQLAVLLAPGEALAAAQAALLRDLATHAGLVLGNLRLSAELDERLIELERQAAELRESRRRLVSAQDEERRRLERDLHDGAQQRLVAMTLKLRLARDLLGRDPDRAGSLLDELRYEAADSIDALRDLARGLHSTILVERGLAPALAGVLARSGSAAELDVDEATAALRFPPDVEAAVFFCCTEALQNATKHATGAPLAFALGYSSGRLVFVVRDGGTGFDVETALHSGGVGLVNMRDRVEALGGTLSIESARRGGTTVTGTIPCEPVADGRRQNVARQGDPRPDDRRFAEPVG